MGLHYTGYVVVIYLGGESHPILVLVGCNNNQVNQSHKLKCEPQTKLGMLGGVYKDLGLLH